MRGNPWRRTHDPAVLGQCFNQLSKRRGRFAFSGKTFCFVVILQLNLSFGIPFFRGHHHSSHTLFPLLPQKQVHIIFLSISSIEWTPLFRGHLSWSLGCPLHGGSTVLCLYQLPLLNGLLYSGDTWPGPEVIPRWMIHCIIFVSVTSVEWTPLFRGHLAWLWGYPLTYYYYGGSTVLYLYQLPLLKGHRYSGDTWPGPECVYWSDISFQGTPGRPGPECVFWMDAPLYYEWAFSEFPQASIKTRLSAQPLIWKWFSFSCK